LHHRGKSLARLLSKEGELVEHVVLVDLSGPVHLCWERRVVHGVRVVLALQAQPTVLGVPNAVLALVALEEVAGVELHAGLVRPQLNHSPGRGLAHHSHLPHALPVFCHPVQHVVYVVPALHLRDHRAGRGRRPEVERRAGHRRHDTGRDQVGADGRHGGRHDLHGVVEDRLAAVVPAQVPVRVLREVHRRRLVQRPRVHCDAVGEVAVDLVGDQHVEVAGEPLLVIVAVVGEGDVRELAGHALADRPEHLVEPAVPAVQRVVAVVLVRVVRVVLDGEPPAGDAVRHAAHQPAEVGGVVLL
jgi:hypothetical protein